jgi:hypothetical protein
MACREWCSAGDWLKVSRVLLCLLLGRLLIKMTIKSAALLATPAYLVLQHASVMANFT